MEIAQQTGTIARDSFAPGTRRAGLADDNVLEPMTEIAIGDPSPAQSSEGLGNDAELGRVSLGGHVQQEFRAMRAWAMLIDGTDLPLFESIAIDDPVLFSPLSVVFRLRENGQTPVVTFVGDELAALCEPDSSPDRNTQLGSNPLIRLLFAKCGVAIALREPHDFRISWINRSGAQRVARGFVLPFSIAGHQVDCLLATIAPPDDADPTRNEVEMTLQNNDVLLLDQELDPATGPDFGAPQPVTPFILVSLPDSEVGAWPNKQREPSPPALAPASDPTGSKVNSGEVLATRLREARDLAEAAKASESRTHGTLYNAIGAAHDLAVAAADAPEELARMLEAANIQVQPRSPMTAIVKLVFSSSYDKTRLTEYSAALAYARRHGLASGELGPLLRSAEGGLKGVVNEERRLRKADSGKDRPQQSGPGTTLARRLRALPVLPLSELPNEGDEFILVLARRTPQGQVESIGAVPSDLPMLKRAARLLLASQT
jgi:hypothetical protein